jgi:predicted permease
MFEVFQLTLGKVGMLLIFIGIGYFLRWHHDLPDDAGRVLSLLCSLVFLPAYFITNMSRNVTMDVLGEKALLVGYGALFVLSAVGLSFLLSKPLGRSRIERNSLIYAFAFPNYGYFGYPVIEGVFGSAMLADVMVFLIPMSLITHSFGYSLFIGEGKVPLKKVLLTPIVISLLIGIAMGLAGIVLPPFVNSALKGLAGCMSPCSMLLAGFMLGKFPLKDLMTGWRPYAYSAIRLIAIPVIFGAVLLLLGMKGQFMMMPLLIAGIPLGLNLVVYPESQGFEKQASDNAKLCFVSYILALVVLPFTYAILTHLVG